MNAVTDPSQLDPTLAAEIAAEPGGEHIRRCFACGTCTASCPVREVTERYNPRRIIHMALLGLREALLTSDFIWLCSTCYSCHERCPQDVRITELMHAIKNVAVRHGCIPSSFAFRGLFPPHAAVGWHERAPEEGAKGGDVTTLLAICNGLGLINGALLALGRWIGAVCLAWSIARARRTA